MTTLKCVVLPSDAKLSGECIVMIQITQRGKQSRLKTDITVFPANFKNGKVLETDLNWRTKNVKIGLRLAELEKILLDNEDKVKVLDAKGIKSFLETGAINVITDFFKFTEMKLAELKARGNKGTYNPLRNMLRLVREYHGRDSLNFSEINDSFLKGFKAYYLKRHHKINSIAVYTKYIRSMFNDAIDEYNSGKDPVILNYPFRKFKIDIEPTKNRNLHIDIVRKIRDATTKTKREEIAKEIFMLQLFWNGINCKDLFYLKPENIINGRLEYYRFKTGRYHNIKIEPETQKIIEKYKGEKYLLWFADNCKAERTPGKRKLHARIKDLNWLDSDSWMKMLNENLQEIQKDLKLKIQGKLTTHWSKHSFASIAREIGISKDDISLCLGHKSVEKNLKTTGGYISEDFRAVDIANRDLIDFVCSNYLNGESWKKQKTPPRQG